MRNFLSVMIVLTAFTAATPAQAQNQAGNQVQAETQMPEQTQQQKPEPKGKRGCFFFAPPKEKFEGSRHEHREGFFAANISMEKGVYERMYMPGLIPMFSFAIYSTTVVKGLRGIKDGTPIRFNLSDHCNFNTLVRLLLPEADYLDADYFGPGTELPDMNYPSAYVEGIKKPFKDKYTGEDGTLYDLLPLN
jgi:hypothetical protein